LPRSKTAISVLFRGETKPRAYFNEVHIQTLVSSTIYAKAVASEVLDVYPPSLFARRIGCEIVLGASRALAHSNDILPDVCRQVVDMMRVPNLVSRWRATTGYGLEVREK
jgi:hypothetical protein